MPRKPGKERVHTKIVVDVVLDVDKSYSMPEILGKVRESIEFGIQREINHVIAGDLNHKLRGTKALHIIGYVRNWRVVRND